MFKTRRPSVFGVSIALFAIGLSALVFTGCGKGEPSPSPAAKSYMDDPDFRQALKEKRDERVELASARNIVVKKMTAMIEAKKKELKTDDLAQVKAALEKDPEWQSLYQRCLDANQAIKEKRRESMGLARERLSAAGGDNRKISK